MSARVCELAPQIGNPFQLSASDNSTLQLPTTCTVDVLCLSIRRTLRPELQREQPAKGISCRRERALPVHKAADIRVAVLQIARARARYTRLDKCDTEAEIDGFVVVSI